MLHFSSSLVTCLSVLSLVGNVNGYEYSAPPIKTVGTVITGAYALAFLGIIGLNIAVLCMLRGHRSPYVVLLIASILTLIFTIASVVYDLLIADIDRWFFTEGDAQIAMTGIHFLFMNWSIALIFLAIAHLMRVRADNVIRSTLGADTPTRGTKHLLLLFSIGYYSAFALLFIFGTAAGGSYIVYYRSFYESSPPRDFSQRFANYEGLRYTFHALRYVSAIFLGGFVVVIYTTVRRATGVSDKILKDLIYVVFLIHVPNMIQDLVFVILFSDAGLAGRRMERAIDEASLASIILSLGLHTATILALLIMGIKKSSWILPGQPATVHDPRKGVYSVYQPYPVQQVYYPAYSGQANYQTPNYQTANYQTAHDQTANYQTAHDQTANDQNTNDQTANNQTANNQTPS